MTSLHEAPPATLPTVEGDCELVPLFRGRFELAPYVLLPESPAGARAIVEMPRGVLVGRGLRARVKGGSNADWLVVGPDGTGTADYRGMLETDDGAVVYLHGFGRIDLRGGFGSGAVLRGSALFETSDDRSRWLNRLQAVFRGVVVGDGFAGGAVYHDEYFEVR
jgi:hypothetical protein